MLLVIIRENNPIKYIIFIQHYKLVHFEITLIPTISIYIFTHHHCKILNNCFGI